MNIYFPFSFIVDAVTKVSLIPEYNTYQNIKIHIIENYAQLFSPSINTISSTGIFVIFLAEQFYMSLHWIIGMIIRLRWLCFFHRGPQNLRLIWSCHYNLFLVQKTTVYIKVTNRLKALTNATNYFQEKFTFIIFVVRGAYRNELQSMLWLLNIIDSIFVAT